MNGCRWNTRESVTAQVRAVTKALIGGGGGDIHIFAFCPTNFFLKSVVITVDFKRNSSGRTRKYEYAPPINTLVTALAQVSSLGVHRMLREATQNIHLRGLVFVARQTSNFETRTEEFHEFRDQKFRQQMVVMQGLF